MTTYRITQLLLVALIGAGLAIAISAPEAFARDAGAVDAASLPAPAPETAPAETASPDVDPVGVLADIYRAGKSGDWWYVFALALTLITWGARWAMQNVGGFQRFVLDSRAGSVAFTALLSVAGMLASRILAGDAGPPSLDDLLAAAKVGLLAIGGWHALVKPVTNWLKGKLGAGE